MGIQRSWSFRKGFSQYKTHDQFRARLMQKVSCKENSGFLIRSLSFPYFCFDSLRYLLSVRFIWHSIDSSLFLQSYLWIFEITLPCSVFYRNDHSFTAIKSLGWRYLMQLLQQVRASTKSRKIQNTPVLDSVSFWLLLLLQIFG